MSTTRPRRADAQRNAGAVLEAAKTVFATDGVDAPAKLIADRAGVGVGTVYRHFPLRSDLVKAVFRRAVDACADAAVEMTAAYPPDVALALWLERFTEFVATKRGLAAALHSGDPAFDELPAYFMGRFEPTLSGLLSAAAASGAIRADVGAMDLLRAVAQLSASTGDDPVGHGRRMVALLIDGLRYRAES